MKPKFLFLLFLSVTFTISTALAQVGIGNTNPDASSVLDVTSTTQGVLFPRMTTLQRNAIALPAKGLTIFNTDTNQFQYNSNIPAAPVWNTLSGSTPAVGQSVKYSNTDITTNVNPAAGINIPVFGNFLWNDNPSLYVISGNQITITQAGRYLVNINVSLNSSVQRAAPDVRIAVNGVAVGAFGSSGYIRSMGSHNNSSINFTEVLQLNANDVITITGTQDASSGAVTLRSVGSSNIYIEKKQ
ncbi:hypothetical protein [Aequorivita echinoideorum]|uniref:C1q domain-containing protein n=1 Tax=Aequorivita echinoideorum TaxID=1549647 RepID=A0ABS5S2A8_9FLAO|nr:hypothetical protein [Aequorivita echinoideorum]MBT0607342.1 hypothetical protein [Aequorivita echinoideorum]